MSVVVVFEWTFTPPDYFEVPIKIESDDYTLMIADGKAEARLDSAAYEANPSMCQTLRERLKDRFLGVQLSTYRAYELSGPTITRVHPDGRKDVFLEAELARTVITEHPVNFQIRDKDGNIIADSTRDRIEKERWFADMISIHRDSDATLAFLLDCHSKAVRDPNNEIVRLYEIREALSKEFRGDEKARSALGISSADWSRFGALCNNEPHRLSRHCGKFATALRDATESELVEARRIATGMIEAYLLHLDSLARSSR